MAIMAKEFVMSNSKTAETANRLVGNAINPRFRHQLELARRAGNSALVHELENRWVSSRVIRLPHHSSLEEVYLGNGGKIINEGTEHELVEPIGEMRRLDAGLNSFNNRGMGSVEWKLYKSGEKRLFRAVSDGGLWTNRTWSVSSEVNLRPDKVTGEDSVMAVRSSAKPDEWTGFYGGPLDTIIPRRIGHYLAIRGFYELGDPVKRPDYWVPDGLSDDEAASYNRDFPSPIEAATYVGGTEAVRVVLWDDDYGNASLECKSVDSSGGLQTDVEQMALHSLRRVAWDYTE